jgi:hypothetical protein
MIALHRIVECVELTGTDPRGGRYGQRSRERRSAALVVTAGARWARSPRRGERFPLLVWRASDPWTVALRWRRRRTSCARKV